MFRKKEDPTELELLRIRVKNLEKQNKELRQAQPAEVRKRAERKERDEYTMMLYREGLL